MRSLALRYVFRTLAKSRSFLFVTVATLALGIGANTAIFAAVSAMFLRPLPYPDAERIVRMWETFGKGGRGSVSEENFRDWRPSSAPGEERRTEYLVASSDYFRTMGIPVVRGRALAPTDRDGTPRVVVVNQTLVQRYFPDEDALGQRLATQGAEWEIVGVVADVRRWGLAQAPVSETYFPYPQLMTSTPSLAVKTRGEPGAAAAAVRAAVSSVDPAQAAFAVKTMPDIIVDSIAARRFETLVLSVFALVATVLAALGIYGVTTYQVSQRTHEIGVRMALGADAGRVRRMVVADAMRLCVRGLAVGVVTSVVLAQLFTRLLFGVGTTDVPSYAGSALVLSAVAFVASWPPARRATRVDPMVALRSA